MLSTEALHKVILASGKHVAATSDNLPVFTTLAGFVRNYYKKMGGRILRIPNFYSFLGIGLLGLLVYLSNTFFRS